MQSTQNLLAILVQSATTPGFDSRQGQTGFSLGYHWVHMGSGAHPVSYPVLTESKPAEA